MRGLGLQTESYSTFCVAVKSKRKPYLFRRVPWEIPIFNLRQFFWLLKTVTDNNGTELDQLSTIQSYLVQPQLALSGPGLRGIPLAHTTGDRLFSIQLRQILNTYWMAAIGVDPLFLGHPADYSKTTFMKYGASPTVTDPSNTYNFSETKGTVHIQLHILRYDKG